jgi:hypothetical protein
MSSNSPLPQASGLKAFACRARWLAPTFGPSIHKTARKFTKVALAVLASNTTELGGRNFDCSYEYWSVLRISAIKAPACVL